MKRLITILLIVSCLFVPSFVYAEGGKEMAYKVPTVQDMINAAIKEKPTSSMTKTKTPNTYNGIEIPEGMTQEEARQALNPGDAHAGLLDSLPDYERPVNTDYYPRAERDSTPYIDYAALLAQQQAQYEAQIKAMKEAQIQSRINALDSQRSSALTSLDAEKSNVAPTYYNMRNQAAAASDKGALNFAQFMASRGVQGNAGAMPEIYRNASLQGQIGALNQQEASDLANIEARRSQINTAYESDVAAAKAEAEAQALQNTLNMQIQAQKDALEQSRYNTQLKNQADVTAYNRLQDTKNEYANTVSRFGDNYQAEIDKVTNDGDPSNDWQIAILQAARAKKIQDMEDAKAAQAAAAAKAQQQAFENDLKLKQYNLDVQKTNYDINKPYSTVGEKTLTPLQQQTNTNNSKIAQMTNWIYNVPTNQEALQRLTQNKALILQQLQEAGYDGSAALQYYQNMYTDLTSN